MTMNPYIHRFLPSTHTWKAVLAAVISWVIAARTGSEHPFFAPLAAILCLQVTIEKSIRIGFQRMLGILVGVVLAGVFAHAIGTSWWSLALLLLIGLTSGQAFSLPQYTSNQIATSILLVLTVGTKSSYGIDRIVETLIGATVGIVINIVILPPDFSRRAEASLWHALSDLAGHYRRFSDWVRNGLSESDSEEIRRSIQALAIDLKQTAKQTEEAMHALKFSPFSQRRRKRLELVRQSLNTLELGYIHGMELQRLLVEISRTTGVRKSERIRWARYFSEFAADVEQWREASITGKLPQPTRLMKELAHHSLTKENYEAAFLVETHRLLADFSRSDDDADRMFPEARLTFGSVSDGRGRAHDLTED